ncbi:hypothetical protein B0H11DRAFT_2245268 [Mycena galericulata]|nr:hypothetical protein B0H11DRAFT_2245268 [Mycena galericulata]
MRRHVERGCAADLRASCRLLLFPPLLPAFDDEHGLQRAKASSARALQAVTRRSHPPPSARPLRRLPPSARAGPPSLPHPLDAHPPRSPAPVPALLRTFARRYFPRASASMMGAGWARPPPASGQAAHDRGRAHRRSPASAHVRASMHIAQRICLLLLLPHGAVFRRPSHLLGALPPLPVQPGARDTVPPRSTPRPRPPLRPRLRGTLRTGLNFGFSPGKI